MHLNRAKARLRAGETVIGSYVRHPDAGIAEILCYLGFDFLLFDGDFVRSRDDAGDAIEGGLHVGMSEIAGMAVAPLE